MGAGDEQTYSLCVFLCVVDCGADFGLFKVRSFRTTSDHLRRSRAGAAGEFVHQVHQHRAQARYETNAVSAACAAPDAMTRHLLSCELLSLSLATAYWQHQDGTRDPYTEAMEMSRRAQHDPSVLKNDPDHFKKLVSVGTDCLAADACALFDHCF